MSDLRDTPQPLTELEIDAVSGALSITDIPKGLKAISDAIEAGVNFVVRKLEGEFRCC
jgi:hypothetical protein